MLLRRGRLARPTAIATPWQSSLRAKFAAAATMPRYGRALGNASQSTKRWFWNRIAQKLVEQSQVVFDGVGRGGHFEALGVFV